MDVILSDKIDNLSSLVEYYGGIKSIQRGVMRTNITIDKNKSAKVEIGNVNPDKSLAIIAGAPNSFNGSGQILASGYVSEINETSFNLVASFARTNSFSPSSVECSFCWQVIEFK